ncbi:MAG: AAA family ATPase [Anaerolineae bacterium]|nr:AAA family ATPase [Anaerolineae bacterium]
MSRAASPKLIVVTGAPATGKTVLARYLAQTLELPLISKDEIKEQLLDECEPFDPDRSKTIGEISFNRLFQLIEGELRAKRSLVAEANFKWTLGHHNRFQKLQQQVECCTIQIHCRAASATILDRFQKRVTSGQRHPGHNDQFNMEALAQNLYDNIYDIDIGGQRVTIDTTDFSLVDYKAIADICQG